ncbi:MAG: GrpB family protein, partial [Chloroflexi bacterium]|nr:GrpB family protein [Chloroflexota bacterium]
SLIAAGYWPRGENGIPGRRFYVKGTDEARTHHVHVFGADSPEVERHLAFRDFMIAHPAEAQAYARLKEDLAARFPEDAEGYVAGKDAFVQEREARASAWRRDRES